MSKSTARFLFFMSKWKRNLYSNVCVANYYLVNKSRLCSSKPWMNNVTDSRTIENSLNYRHNLPTARPFVTGKNGTPAQSKLSVCRIVCTNIDRQLAKLKKTITMNEFKCIGHFINSIYFISAQIHLTKCSHQSKLWNKWKVVW